MPRKGAGGSQNSDRTVLQAVPLNPPKVEPHGPGVPVPIEEIAPNPRNLREDELWESPGERAAMVASLASTGLIQALVVCELKEFLKKYPKYAGTDRFTAKHRFVVIAGHCRLDAAPDAGLTELRVDVQNGLVDKMDEVFIQENMRRNALNPFHEGLGYDRLARERRLSNQELAQLLGVSKSLVVKRRTLLRIEKRDRFFVNTGVIGLDAAYNLLAALGDAPGLFGVAVEILTENADLTVKDAAAMALDPAPRGSEADGHESPDAEPLVPAPRDADQPDAALVPAGAGAEAGEQQDVDARPSTPPAAPAPAAAGVPNKPAKQSSTASAPAKDDQERAAATAARDRACQELVATYPADLAADPASARIVTAALANATKEGLKLAHRWVCAADAAQADALGPDAYRDMVMFGNDPSAALRMAYAVALAEEEVRASDRRRKWGPRTRHHVQHLIDSAGYTPNGWEQRNL